MKRILSLPFTAALFLLCLIHPGLRAQAPTTFAFTGAAQTYVVPNGVNLIEVELWGAQGGSAGASNGGLGGYVKGTLNVIPGQVLNIYVGGQNGYNGGGTAGSGGGYISANGGGASDIRIGGVTLSDRIVVAGGGGGSGRSSCSAQHGGGGGYPGGFGGNGDGAFGGNGTATAGGSVGGGGSCNSCCASSRGGGGGGGNGGGAQGGYSNATGGTGGGCGGNNSDYSGGCGNYAGGGGCFGIGGNGIAAACNGGGGGGGGGWYGGGSGGSNWGSGGGGGSSYLGTLTSTSFSNAIRSGNGVVTILDLFTATVTVNNALCNGANGSATLSVNGQPGPYTYTWLPSGGNASVATVGAGTYTGIATSSNGFTTSAVAVIGQPSALVASIASQTNVTCSGGSNGAVSLSISGGTPTYSVTWLPAVGNSASVSNLSAGFYTATVTDANNCTVTPVSINITQPAPVIVSANSSTTALCLGGSVILTGSGASTYTWTGGITDGVAFQPSGTLGYTVTGADGNGCMGTAATTVTVHPLPVISVNSGSICSGNSFTMNPGGANTYTYSSGSAIVSPNANTSYSVTGTSLQGCVSSNTAVSSVTVYITPTVSVNSGSICSGNSFTMVPGGATTYTYSSGSAIVSPNVNTSYSVTGTSLQGCVSSNTAVSNVIVNITPTVSVNSGSICSGNSFTMIAGGANTYTYSSGIDVVTPSVTTSYSVTGTSLQGCVSSNTAVSNVTVNITPTVSVNSGSICSGNSFTLVASGANTYTYSSGSDVVTPSVTTSYSVTGTSLEGCESSMAVSEITVSITPTITVTSGTICAGESFTIVPGGAATYTFSNGTAVVSPGATASYSVSGSNADGCVSSNTAVSTVSVSSLPTVSASVSEQVICEGQQVTLSGSGADTYTWTGGVTNNVPFSPSVTASYTVTGTDNQTGCLNTAVVTQSVSECTALNEAAPMAPCLQVYPNPNAGDFTISGSTDMSLLIVNALGQVVKELSLNAANHATVSVSNLAKGVYFVVGRLHNTTLRHKVIVAD